MRGSVAMLAFSIVAVATVFPHPPTVISEEEPPETSGSAWRVEVLDPSPYSMAHPDIDIDSRGRPHVSWCSKWELRYALRSPVWITENVTRLRSDWCGPLSLDPTDAPHIGIHGSPADLDMDLKYAFKEAGVWSFLPVNHFFGLDDMTVDSSGRTHAVLIGQGLEVLYSLRVGTTWTDEVIDVLPFEDDGGRFRWVTLALDGSDLPHVLYYGGTLGEVRYAFRDETGWNTELVERIGTIRHIDRQGSLAVDAMGTVHASFLGALDWFGKTATLRYGVRGPAGWSLTTIDGPPQMEGFWPSLLLSRDGLPRIGYQSKGPSIQDYDLWFAEFDGLSWTFERGYDSASGTDLPSFAIDACDNPHAVFREGAAPTRVVYAARGAPCDGLPRGVFVEVHPDTLNVKSRGRWVTAYVIPVGATVDEMDPSTLALNGVPISWFEANESAIMARFDRAALIATLANGEFVLVTLAGVWSDGETFLSTDTIRVIRPGR